ncbi:HAD-like domain-containing protein [Xylaria arbuscula]|nr:HAD-like domain-containing protein [Xylaria arbuscula]
MSACIDGEPKIMRHFRRHPQDFLYYFFPIPAYHLFAWLHTFIKLYAALTFFNISWAGRNLKTPEEVSIASPVDVDGVLANRVSFAFAFDVDGVLVNGERAVEGAPETIRTLKRRGIPFILLTNGGGKTEEGRVTNISQCLDVTLSKDQFVQSHTPYRGLVPQYRDKNILAIGGADGKIRDIAEGYGFKNVFTDSDIWLACKTRHPFPEFTQSKHQEIAKEEKAALIRKGERIDAILVWCSPRDWCFGFTILVDYCSKDDAPALFFAHSDSVWSTGYEQPRLALGAFISGFEGVWKTTMKGQAMPEYTLATSHGKHLIKTVYMIGDNPESDIQGAKNYVSPYKTKWEGLLVETGVYKPGTLPAHQPINTCHTCQDAVQWALEREGYVC